MIKFDNVLLSYNGREVLSNLSFEIRRGDKVVVVGKSGLGKSSLFSLILGFALAQKGRICFDGVPVDEKSVWDVRSKVAFVDQDVSLGDGKVSDCLSFASDLKANVSSDFGNERIRELFDCFGLGMDALDKNVGDLSGGERQRLAIVISILLGRSVFLLDEVTSALDKHWKEKVSHYFCSRDDWTVVVISHDPVWLKNSSVRVYDLEV